MRCRVLASLERAPRLRSGMRASAVIAPFPPLPKSVTGPPMRSLTDIFEEYDFLDGDDRYRLLIELGRSEEHTSELQSLMRISYAVFCLKKKKIITSVTYADLRKLLHTLKTTLET